MWSAKKHQQNCEGFINVLSLRTTYYNIAGTQDITHNYNVASTYEVARIYDVASIYKVASTYNVASTYDVAITYDVASTYNVASMIMRLLLVVTIGYLIGYWLLNSCYIIFSNFNTF